MWFKRTTEIVFMLTVSHIINRMYWAVCHH